MKLRFYRGLEFFLYFAALGLWYVMQYKGWNGEYVDSDNYFHAKRLILFFENPSYWEQIFPFTNYPFGEILHWTRAFDLFWGVLALPFLSVMPLNSAVFYSGLLVAPLFGFLALFCFLKASRLFLLPLYQQLALGIIFVQSNVMCVLFFNRPDHHAAFLFLTLLLFWLMAEFIKTKQIRDLTWAACVSAFALFMGVEGVFLFIVIAGFLWYAYLFLGYSWHYLSRFCLCFALTVCCFWLLNPPYEGLWLIDVGRLSCFYVLAAFVCAGCVYASQKIISPFMRIGGALGGITLFIFISFYCGWLTSPLDERIIPIFIDRVSEMHSGNFYLLAYPFISIVAALFMFAHKRQNGFFIFLFLFTALYSVLTFFSMRFVSYAGTGAALLLAWGLQDSHYGKAKRFFLMLFLILWEYISFTIFALSGNHMEEHFKHNYLLEVPVEELRKLPQGTFASDIFLAPYLIWNGNHNVIASPYHRNVEGITDNHDIFFSSDENEVLSLIKKHKVTYIFLLDMPNDTYYIEPERHCDKLYGKILGCHHVPSWLEPLSISEGHLYKVVLP